MQEFKDQNSQQDKIMFQAEATASPFQSLLCRFKMPRSRCYKSKFWAAVLGTTDLLKQNLASTSKTHEHHCSSVTHQNKTLLSVTQDTAHQRKALMMRKQPADTALT